MKIYHQSEVEKWRELGIHTKVLAYIENNPGKEPSEIAEALGIAEAQVLWALNVFPKGLVAKF